jgi:hypothetical protein
MRTRAPRQGAAARQRPAAFSGAPPAMRAVRSTRLRASSGDNDEGLQNKFFGDDQASTSSPGSGADGAKGAQEFSIDSVNPYALGRQARAAFDGLWNQVTRVAQPNRSYIFDDVLQPEAEESSQFANTTVLVLGATGRVGRILTRKLLLRGYKVKALVRKRDGAEGVPEAVELVEGDVGDNRDVQAAMRGVDKVSGRVQRWAGAARIQRPRWARLSALPRRHAAGAQLLCGSPVCAATLLDQRGGRRVPQVIFCAAARSSFTGDLLRVEDRGVMNVVKAMQVCLGGAWRRRAPARRRAVGRRSSRSSER